MSEVDQGRRALLVALPAGGGLVAIGGATIIAMNARGYSGYQEAVSSTWRHSDTTDLSLSSAQRELVRYATLAANSHNSVPTHSFEARW
jgi:hypothetical protein